MAKVSNTTTPKQTKEWGGAFDAFGKSLKQVRANPEPALFYVVAYFAIYLLEIYAPGPGSPDSVVRVFSYEGLAGLLFLLAIPTYALAVADRKRIGISDFLRFNARKYFFVLAVTILYTLIVVSSLLLLILPAIWTIAWFALGTLLVVDKNLGPIAALKESKRLVQNHKAKVWGIIGAAILLSLGASLVFLLPGLGQIAGPLLSAIIAVLTTAAYAQLLRWAQHHSA